MKLSKHSCLIIAIVIACVKIKAQSVNDKPNVLVIYTDDHRYSGVHALGGMEVKTPNIDALAANGVAFTKAYLMGAFSGATCVPSRAMLLSGRNVFQLQGKGFVIPQQHATIGETFKKSGYYTHIVGKWHQDKGSLHRSFNSGDKIMGLGVYLQDHFRMPFWDWDTKGVFKKEDAYLISFDHKGKRKQRVINKEDKKGPFGTEKDGPHTSEVFAESASEFIKKYRKKEPFMMYLAFHAPHDPRQAPEKFKKAYPEGAINLPPSYMEQHPFDNGHMYLRDEALAPWPRTKQVAQKHLSDYYAAITHLDTQIGKVIQSLKNNGKYENTLIVFAGDSGLAVGNHGLMGKQNIYDEDGVHVPLILSGGVIKNKGERIEKFTYIHDIFPTICELAGVTIPSSVKGKSLVPLLQKQTLDHRKSTYHAYKQFQRAYREGDFKLIEYVRAKNYSKEKGEYFTGSRVTQLFNVKVDPWETQDLSFFPEYQVTVMQMQEAMKKRAIELGDKKENIAGEKYDFWEYY